MTELGEMHSTAHHDSFGKAVGILTAILAVMLSVFTISAHRAHTNTIILQNSANDAWSRYQAKRIRDYQLEMSMDLLKILAPSNPDASKTMKDYNTKRDQYTKDLSDIKTDAEFKVHDSEVTEIKAQYFDLAEGVLEISLVMSSLYFIARKKLFPVFGLVFGLMGIIVGTVGFFM